ncbi:MAG: DUF87 domain-containing protein [Candidatus Micrarchaeales archaeon]|jgi:DNA helicase HerA-like ATPase|uniref:AAA ATPase n=1 Tax=Candidatus Micrarchaeum acidiphilum ARMAN-2 TaxID=425595 RepID=C7DG84_MICA2|nr:MAG: AAA ATPase [Candidatus Micrarchaeum acidiphilum ARMAN-2]MCW6161177.1 DUF87 domain-containing protein [Candidatus Micrarchaeales archaeon]
MDDFEIISNSRALSASLPIVRMSEPVFDGKDLDEGVYLGNTKIYGMPFLLNTGKLVNPHIAAVGMSGSGKTFLLKSLISSYVIDLGYNAIALDWSGEYADLFRSLGGKVWKVGRGSGIGLVGMYCRNPVRLCAEMEWILTDLYGLDGADVREVKDVIGMPRRGPISLDGIIDGLRSFGSGGVNTAAKLGAAERGCILPGGSGFRLNRVFDGACTVDLSGIASGSERVAAGKLLVNAISDAMHSRSISDRTDTLLVLDEAWKLCDHRALNELLRESRKYGISVVLATQQAMDMNAEALSNIGCCFVFKLNRMDGGSAEFSERIGSNIEAAGNLGRGSCIVSMARRDSEARDNFILARVI